MGGPLRGPPLNRSASAQEIRAPELPAAGGRIDVRALHVAVAGAVDPRRAAAERLAAGAGDGGAK